MVSLAIEVSPVASYALAAFVPESEAHLVAREDRSVLIDLNAKFVGRQEIIHFTLSVCHKYMSFNNVTCSPILTLSTQEPY
jgi:hypothetical protein